MKPWECAVPPVLYKYLPPERVHVLEDCRIRFSQRTVFEDDHELQPDFASFGTLSEIWRFTLAAGLRLDGRLPANVLLQLIAESPKHQAQALHVAQKHMKSPDTFGIFCLTESPDNEQMWTEYADHERGFVIGFDTGHADFAQLRVPGKLGKVEYSDEPLGSFLGMMEDHAAGIFFRKRLKYTFEAEWRSIRALNRLERHADVYLAPFSPACVREVIIRPHCARQGQLRGLIEGDARYDHATVIIQDEAS